MTTEEYIAKQRKAFNEIIEKDKPLQIAAKTVVAAQATRIFVEGKNSQGSLIGKSGYNDNKEIYVNPSTSPGKKFKPAGKPFEFGRTKAGKIKNVRSTSRLTKEKGEERASAKAHKTRWFSSYKDYRNTIGRRTDVVDWFLSGDLKSDFSNSKTNPAPRKVNNHEYVSGLKRDENIKKLEGLEDKYGEVTKHTKGEKELFFSTVGKEFQLILTNA